VKNYNVKSVPTFPPLTYDIMSRRLIFRPTCTCHIISTSFVALVRHMTFKWHVFVKNYRCSYVQLYASWRFDQV